MNCKVELTEHFSKEAKRLSKKFPSLKQDLEAFITDISANPSLGTSLGMDVFKVRMAISSKGKGKRGGARVITFFRAKSDLVVLLTIYNKGEKNSITAEEIKQLLAQWVK
jgi:mRNA-degrading endonuclease RelE of RelBE toxin-antitoxin system